MNRLRVLLAAALLTALSAAARAATIGVSMANLDDNFLTGVGASIQTRARELKVAIQFEDAQDDIGRQLNQIENFIAAHVDAIIVNAVDTDATPRLTQLVAAARIPLVYVNRMPADRHLPPRVSFVGSDEVQSGSLEMNEVCRLLHGKGDILILMGELTSHSARQRTQDVYDVIGKPGCRGIHVLDQQAADWKRTAAADLVTNWLSGGLRPQAIVANDDEMAIGAIQALKQAQLLSSTVVAGINATPDGLAEMKAGELKVTVYQNAGAQGRRAVDTALSLMRNESVPVFVWIPFELVTPANLASYLGQR